MQNSQMFRPQTMRIGGVLVDGDILARPNAAKAETAIEALKIATHAACDEGGYDIHAHWMTSAITCWGA